ncbi:MAG TPA: hypothetical protein VJU61_07530 [Polyangiaceae bacterium]|nr:hypothetical protein [Polyangiaceae bacterium]
MSIERARAQVGRAAWEWTRRASCALLALSLVTSAAFGGAFYLWCIPMARAMSECCCHGGSAEHGARVEQPDASHASVEAPCCETRALGKLAAASGPSAEANRVSPPSWVLVPAALAPVLESPRRLALSSSQPARAGPPPPKIPRYLRIRTLLL